MKKLLIVLLLAISTTAFAQHHGHGWKHHRHQHHGPNLNYWIAPMVIGGVVGAVVANNRRAEPVIIEQQPIVIQSQPNCTAWKEIEKSDGTIYRERTCYGLQ